MARSLQQLAEEVESGGSYNCFSSQYSIGQGKTNVNADALLRFLRQVRCWRVSEIRVTLAESDAEIRVHDPESDAEIRVTLRVMQRSG